jgi:hypothetical protein
MTNQQKLFNVTMSNYRADPTEERRIDTKEYVNMLLAEKSNVVINLADWFTLQGVMK